MKKFIGYVVGALFLFAVVIGIPILSVYAIYTWVGFKTAVVMAVVVTGLFAYFAMFWSGIVAHVDNRLSKTTIPKVGEVLNEEALNSLIISEKDLTLEEYISRVIFLHNDNTVEGINALTQYLNARVSGTTINFAESPLPLVIKLLTLVDSKLPSSTTSILYSNSTDDGDTGIDEFSGFELDEHLKN